MQRASNSTTRFSDRVADYVRYRPHYPESMTATLQEAGILDRNTIVADIGSGTGLSSEPFLRFGNTVYAVEPNREMREASEALYSNYATFKAVNGSAEATTLPAATADLIFCGQAYHWFDPRKTREEFTRILRPGGSIVLAWNERSTSDPLQQEYEQLLRTHVAEYSRVTQRNINSEQIRSFLQPFPMQVIALENSQEFDLEGLKGRMLSSSYSPKPGEATYFVVMEGLEQLFEKYQNNGHVTFRYDTLLYIGNEKNA